MNRDDAARAAIELRARENHQSRREATPGLQAFEELPPHLQFNLYGEAAAELALEGKELEALCH